MEIVCEFKKKGELFQFFRYNCSRRAGFVLEKSELFYRVYLFVSAI